jgi:hypothetical protein
LKENFDDYWKSRGRNLTHNLSRQRRRLAEKGSEIELRVSRDFNRVDKCIREYGLLEQGGWKGKKGSAVSEENRQGLLYRDILRTFCERDEGVIYQLVMNGRTVASDLCLERDGMIVILKTAYDETVEGYSLGLLLHQEMTKAMYSEGKIKVIEFYGHVRDWHTKLTNEIRTMFHMNFYRHDWVASARKYLKTSSSLLKYLK